MLVGRKCDRHGELALEFGYRELLAVMMAIVIIFDVAAHKWCGPDNTD